MTKSLGQTYSLLDFSEGVRCIIGPATSLDAGIAPCHGTSYVRRYRSRYARFYPRSGRMRRAHPMPSRLISRLPRVLFSFSSSQVVVVVLEEGDIRECRRCTRA